MTTSPRKVWTLLAGERPTPLSGALSIGLGLFLGLLPISPFQTAAALALAFLFKANRVLTLAGTMVWQPFTFPFILAAECAVGRWILGQREVRLDGFWSRWGLPALVGAPIFAGACAVAAGAITYLVLRWRAAKRGGVPEGTP